MSARLVDFADVGRAVLMFLLGVAMVIQVPILVRHSRLLKVVSTVTASQARALNRMMLLRTISHSAGLWFVAASVYSRLGHRPSWVLAGATVVLLVTVLSLLAVEHHDREVRGAVMAAVERKTEDPLGRIDT